MLIFRSFEKRALFRIWKGVSGRPENNPSLTLVEDIHRITLTRNHAEPLPFSSQRKSIWFCGVAPIIHRMHSQGFVDRLKAFNVGGEEYSRWDARATDGLKIQTFDRCLLLLLRLNTPRERSMVAKSRVERKPSRSKQSS